VPLPWPTATPPAGWLKCNGAAFDKNAYPQLALAYPSGKLPDLRGEFIRGFDDGRGVDTGRQLLSAQADSFAAHTHLAPTYTGDVPPGPDNYEVASTSHPGYDYFPEVPTSTTGGTETRPRNLAFHYIVRAA
jgi:hypothetical protein